ncbi:RNA-binding ATPase activator esf2 [Neophaeococcomyces mojaviensis]|uniref:RNA-binding ATPase activator esf2 n=1 Tax=Neophaeococcomyces mojaviensis TaxID=3383035 RepID=A0ACC3AA44_9EURO|nr:RNA-binding ATPase activator esf2 [Knufia sp. JES_112]
MSQRNEYLDQGVSDNSESESGYDSEAVEISRTRRDAETSRSKKRRKLSHSSGSSDDEVDVEASFITAKDHISPVKKPTPVVPLVQTREDKEEDADEDVQDREVDYEIKSASTVVSKTSKKPKKKKTPGVIYLSSLPPYLKPSALRNLLSQRGFEPITRLFLTPASKHKHNSKKSSRQLYTEGWIEFASKKTAKRCAEALNAQLVGGRKGGFYHDDIWNMKYLKGMAWDELMTGIREERREEEGMRDEERRKIAAETKAFVQGVEQSKRLEGMKRKRKSKAQEDSDAVQRTWRQHEVARDRSTKDSAKEKKSFDPEVQQVLSKIF